MGLINWLRQMFWRQVQTASSHPLGREVSVSRSRDSVVDDLVTAARAGDAARIKHLVESGADINTTMTTGATGWTALMVVSYNWERDAVRLLLDEGASPDVSDHPCDTARSLAKEGASCHEFWSDEDCEQMSKEILSLLDSRPGPVQGRRTARRADAIVRGGFGEPYCSHACHDRAGEEILSRSFRGTGGVCGFCQTPVSADWTQAGQNALFPFRGQILHICPSCLPRGKDYVKDIRECCMCGKPIAPDLTETK